MSTSPDDNADDGPAVTHGAQSDGSALEGARVVIVGGASGLGQATAQAALSAGAEVSIVSRNRSSVEVAISELGVGSRGFIADSTDADAMRHTFEQIGPFDHLVYTAAGPAVSGHLTRLDIADVRDAFETRYFGAVTTVKAAADYIASSGSITLTSGAATVRPRATSAVLASICGAMESLSRALAVELAPVRVNIVRPGFTRTHLWAELDGRARQALFDDTAKTNLVGHVGEASELALAYLYCMTQTYGTGAVIAADGGYALV